MKAKLQRVSMILLLALMVGLLAACGGGSTDEGTDTPDVVEETGETDDAAGEEPAGGEEVAGGDEAMGGLPASCESVSLEYWNPFTGPDGPFMGEIVDNFNADHPNINVVMTTQAEYYTQLGTAAASDTLPDVAIVHADQIATQAYRNVLRPMDDVIAQMEVSGDEFPADVWAAGEVSGRRYSIPLDIHPMTLFYNVDMLEAAGIDPATWEDGLTGEEFESAIAAMSEGDGSGFMLTTGFPNRQIFEQLLHQAGGSAFNADGTEVTWDSPEGIRALEWMREAQTTYGEPSLEVDAELNAFKGGTVGAVWNGIWQTTNLTGEAVGFQGRATGVPQIFENPATWGGSHQLTLPAQSDEDPCRDAAAGIFIDYLLANSVTWAGGGQIPANNTVRSSDAFMQIQPQASIAPSVEGVFFPPAVPGITDAYGPLDEAVAAVLAGEATDIEATLADAAGRAEQILEENRSNYGELQ